MVQGNQMYIQVPLVFVTLWSGNTNQWRPMKTNMRFVTQKPLYKDFGY